jgi:hypothetical protein
MFVGAEFRVVMRLLGSPQNATAQLASRQQTTCAIASSSVAKVRRCSCAGRVRGPCDSLRVVLATISLCSRSSA